MYLQRKTSAVLMLLFLAVLAAGCPGGTPFRRGPVRMRSEPTISVYFHENGTKKNMPIEEYLVGVVAGEMKPDWPENAYAAQAILARTFTMEFISRGGTRKLHATDICTDEKHAQAYTTSAITPVIRRAVDKTKGLVMLYGGKYVKGWFSASCGGRTTYARIGLAYKGQEPPYIASVECLEDQVIPKAEQLWQAGFSGSELDAALRKAAGKSVGPVTQVAAAHIDRATHRTVTLRLTGPNGTAEIPAADLRVAIGPERMRSIWFTEIKSSGGSTSFSGRGFGHGVGLCQWGSYALAKSGKAPAQIVQHYYPKVQIARMW